MTSTTTAAEPPPSGRRARVISIGLVALVAVATVVGAVAAARDEAAEVLDRFEIEVDDSLLAIQVLLLSQMVAADTLGGAGLIDPTVSTAAFDAVLDDHVIFNSPGMESAAWVWVFPEEDTADFEADLRATDGVDFRIAGQATSGVRAVITRVRSLGGTVPPVGSDASAALAPDAEAGARLLSLSDGANLVVVAPSMEGPEHLSLAFLHAQHTEGAPGWEDRLGIAVVAVRADTLLDIAATSPLLDVTIEATPRDDADAVVLDTEVSSTVKGDALRATRTIHLPGTRFDLAFAARPELGSHSGPPPWLAVVALGATMTVGLAAVLALQLRRDRYARHRVEEATAGLRAANAALTDTVASHDALLSTVAHELATPLSVVSGFAQTLRRHGEQLDGDDRRRAYDSIAHGAERLERLRQDLLTASRLAFGNSATEPDDVLLAPVVHAAVNDLPEIPGDVLVNVDGRLLAHADPHHVRMIVSNLVGNAAKYGQPPIVIEAYRLGPSVRLSVRDHGPGLPEDVVPRLFERFTRGRTAASSSTPGTGLGLWIVRNLSVANGGEVTYAPADPGASFIVTLPAGTTTPSADPSAAARHAGDAVPADQPSPRPVAPDDPDGREGSDG